MLGDVFTHAVWARRRALAWWTAGTCAYVLLVASAFPAVADAGDSVTLASFVDWLDVPQRLLPHYYYAATQPLVDGLSLVHAGTLAAVAVAATALGVAGIGRRDVVR